MPAKNNITFEDVQRIWQDLRRNDDFKFPTLSEIDSSLRVEFKNSISRNTLTAYKQKLEESVTQNYKELPVETSMALSNSVLSLLNTEIERSTETLKAKFESAKKDVQIGHELIEELESQLEIAQARIAVAEKVKIESDAAVAAKDHEILRATEKIKTIEQTLSDTRTDLASSCVTHARLIEEFQSVCAEKKRLEVVLTDAERKFESIVDKERSAFAIERASLLENERKAKALLSELEKNSALVEQRSSIEQIAHQKAITDVKEALNELRNAEKERSKAETDLKIAQVDIRRAAELVEKVRRLESENADIKSDLLRISLERDVLEKAIQKSLKANN